jgi:hypothetical protein
MLPVINFQKVDGTGRSVKGSGKKNIGILKNNKAACKVKGVRNTF